MATPTLPSVKNSWQINANNQASSNSFSDQRTLFNIKDILISFDSNPWTVVSSSNSVTSGAADYWDSFEDLVWSTGNHSWIVLQKPSTNSQILISLDRSSSDEILFSWSPDGYFTGGNTSTDPTATDQIDIFTGQPWDGGQSNRISYVNIWHTEDGSKTRIILTSNNGTKSFWIFDEITTAFSDWDYPEIVGIVSNSDSAVLFDDTAGWSTYPPSISIYDGSSDYSCSFSPYVVDAVPIGFSGSSWHSIQEYSSELSFGIDSYPWSPVILYSDDTGARGVHGIIEDLYISSEVTSSGATYPNNSAQRNWAQYGHFVMPWTGDDTVPIVDFSFNVLDLLDQTSNNYHGTLNFVDNDDFEPDVPLGSTFSTVSVNVDGNETFNMGNVLAFDYTDPFSFSMWIKTTTTGGTKVLLSKSNNSQSGYEFNIGSGGEFLLQLVKNIGSNSMRVRTTDDGWNDGNWHHIVGTWDGNASGDASGANIYVDGYSKALTFLDNNLSSSILNSNPFTLCARNVSNSAYVGSMDEVSVWSKELSSLEVTSLYNDGVATDVSEEDFADGYLEAFWRMGEGIFDIIINNPITIDAYLMASNVSSDASGEVNNFIMIGRDTGAPIQPTYHYWTVQGSPDPTGALAIGADAPPNGGPLADIYVSAIFKTTS